MVSSYAKHPQQQKLFNVLQEGVAPSKPLAPF